MKRAPAVIAIVILVSACSAAGPVASRTPSPSATSSPTPVRNSIDLANEKPLIFFHDPAAYEQVDGMTWAGVVGSAAGVPDYRVANPQATLFGSVNEIRDRKGEVMATGTFGAKSFAATWSDDGAHYCLMQPFDVVGPDPVAATLMVGSVEGRMGRVGQVGSVYEQGSIYVVACSLTADRAVVVQSGGQGVGIGQYWVVKLSTGAILSARGSENGLVANVVVASRDGRYVAEVTDPPGGPQRSVVFGPDGSRVAEFKSSVVGFSWDGERVALFDRSAQQASVARLIDGTVIWRSPAMTGRYVWNTLAEPGGASMAIGLARPEMSAAGYPPVDLYLVSGDGRTVKVLKDVYW